MAALFFLLRLLLSVIFVKLLTVNERLLADRLIRRPEGLIAAVNLTVFCRHCRGCCSCCVSCRCRCCRSCCTSLTSWPFSFLATSLSLPTQSSWTSTTSSLYMLSFTLNLKWASSTISASFKYLFRRRRKKATDYFIFRASFLLATRPNISQFWSFKISGTTLPKRIKFVDRRISRLQD